MNGVNLQTTPTMRTAIRKAEVGVGSVIDLFCGAGGLSHGA